MIIVNYRGNPYHIPTAGETAWSSSLTQYLVALADSAAGLGIGSPANGLSIVENELTLDAATELVPGAVTTTTQTFGGNKTFTGDIVASNLSGSNSGDVTLGAFGSTPVSKGLTIVGQELALQPADATHAGGLSITTQAIAGAKTFSSVIAATAGLTVDTNKVVLNTNGEVIASGMTHVRATTTAGQSMSGTGATVVFGTEAYDVLNEYNASTGVFTALRTGYYAIKAGLTTVAFSATSGMNFQSYLVINGAGQSSLGSTSYAQASLTMQLSTGVNTTLHLTAGDTVEVQGQLNSSTQNLDTAAPANHLTIDRLV